MKLVSTLRTHFPLTKKPYLPWRTLTYATRQQPLESQELALAQTIASMESISSNPCFFLLGFCRNIDSLKIIHGSLIVSGLTGELLCDTKLVSMYGSFGRVEHARLVFDRIENPDFYSWKVMIRWYYLNDLYSEVIRFYTRKRICVRECDNGVFSFVLKACCELRDIDDGRKVHCQIVKAGGPDSFVLANLVDMYAKCRDIGSSREVFDEILDRDVVHWTSMIVGYVQNDCPIEGLVLFNRMREGSVKDNQFTVQSLVTACKNLRALHQGKGLHGYLIKKGFEFNQFLSSALLDMYVKCGDVRDARSVFDEFSGIDLVSWTAMIVGYVQNDQPNEALKLFIDKKWVDILPNYFTTTSVLSACSQLRNSDMGRSVHGLGIKLGLGEPSVSNALIDMYAKCHMIRDASYIFETVLDKSEIAWNSIMSGHLPIGHAYEALELFNRMISDSVLPDAFTLATVLSACASVGALRVGSSLHAFSMKEGILSSSVYVGTALLNLYAKCGDVKSARMVFDGMGEKNTITWSAIIGGYGMQGDGSGSLALFSKMLKEKLAPNEVIFTTILSACSHAGMIGEGWRCFNLMCQDFNFVPSMKHYACMVDLLSRAGRLEEALDFIENMPVQPNVSLIGSFLHGCGLNARLDLGEVAIRKMLQLHPNEASYYVLMCNLYASDGRWSQVNQVRELMKQRGLSKSPGCSLVEMDIIDDISPAKVASLP
ncbi:hypothetical protein FH972_008910 [Carpinus fangiana]|uniref:Pentacotripeptide-repeat region of PRORP domain-containing protein n=1 Tax=Carpinus fangiana TaxID=176857 RepID=A0A5N6R2Y5_9ROSI|nr:hypothetical protein FH972_008910 [Carpinus fangiana]